MFLVSLIEIQRKKEDPFVDRESGAIEQDADVVMLLGKHRKGEDIRVRPSTDEDDQSEDYEPIKLLLAKQRMVQQVMWIWLSEEIYEV